MQSANNSRRMSTHFSSLLAEREAHIEKLEEKETNLQQTLDSKVTSESKLKQERNLLLSVSLKKRKLSTTISKYPPSVYMHVRTFPFQLHVHTCTCTSSKLVACM